ncbi:MAG: c-type cytochrome domain-containing protein [Planctomycetota bacterium]
MPHHKRKPLEPCAATLVTLALAAAPAPGAEEVTYQEHVKPILREHCLVCHSQGDASSGLALDSYAATMAGGAGGEILSAGDAAASRFWRLVAHEEGPEMPPGDKIPEEQLVILRKWIDGGLLDDTGSKPKQAKRSAIAQVEVSQDNRPAGEPAAPVGWRRQPVVTAPRVGPVTALAASPWAPIVAVPWQRQVSLYDTEEFRLLGVLPYPDGAPNVVRFSRDGSVLLVAGGVDAKRGSASLFDVKTGVRLATVGDELDTVLTADVSPDLSLVALGGPRKKVRVYRTSDGSLAYEAGKHTDWITAIEFSPDGRRLATADRSAGLLLWQASAGNPRADLRGHKQAVTSVSWRADSAVLASASEDGDVRLWQRDGKSVKGFRAHNQATAVAVARDGRIATTGRDRKVRVWSPEGKPIQNAEPMADSSLAVVFTAAPGGGSAERLVVSDFNGSVRVVDVASGETLGELAANPPTLASRLAAAEARAAAINRELPAAEQAVTAAEASNAAAEHAHEAYADRLEAARQKRRLAQARVEESARKAADYRAEAANDEAAVAAAERVLTAAQAALRVASDNLAEAGDDGSGSDTASSDTTANDSPGGVVQALAQAVDHAKRDVASARQTLEEVKQKQAGAVAVNKKAVKALRAADQVFARVNKRRAGLPDLTATKAAAEGAKQQVETLRHKLAEAKQSVAEASAEQADYLNASAQIAARADRLARARAHAADEVTQAVEADALARKRLATQQTEVDRLADQIATLQSKLRRQQASKRASEEQARSIADRVALLREKLAQADAASVAAEAEQNEFSAAERARAEYLQEASP